MGGRPRLRNIVVLVNRYPPHEEAARVAVRPHSWPRPPESQGVMTHREVLEAMSGLLLAMFVAMLSSTVVSNALPRIVESLHGSQTGYTWVVVATLLTMTATTPIWGKLADLFTKKALVQTALVIYVIGSLIAGTAANMGILIGARAIQGLGVGGLTALVQVVIASMVTPRERGRYCGYIGAVFATATAQRPAHRRPHRRHPGPRLALVLLRRHPGRRGGLRAAPEDAAPARRTTSQATHRLPRRHPAHGRRQHPADLGHAGRQPVRLDLRRQLRCSSSAAWPSSPPRSTSRRGSPSSRSSRCASSATGRRRSPPARRCWSASRCSARRSTSASTSRSPAA